MERLATLMAPESNCPGQIDIGGALIGVCARYVTTKITDLSGNEWTIAYDANDQEYVEHPIILSLSDDENRDLTFHYQALPGEISPTNPRALDQVKLENQVVVDYMPNFEVGAWPILGVVETPEGRAPHRHREPPRRRHRHRLCGTTVPRRIPLPPARPRANRRRTHLRPERRQFDLGRG
jgi:hypothetical protein